MLLMIFNEFENWTRRVGCCSTISGHS